MSHHLWLTDHSIKTNKIRVLLKLGGWISFNRFRMNNRTIEIKKNLIQFRMSQIVIMTHLKYIITVSCYKTVLTMIIKSRLIVSIFLKLFFLSIVEYTVLNFVLILDNTCCTYGLISMRVSEIHHINVRNDFFEKIWEKITFRFVNN